MLTRLNTDFGCLEKFELLLLPGDIKSISAYQMIKKSDLPAFGRSFCRKSKKHLRAHFTLRRDMVGESGEEFG